MTHNKTFKVLSIDGGGIWGIIPAMVLLELEKMVAETTGNPDERVADHFDLIAGTSTGGILTMGLVYPKPNSDPAEYAYSAEDLVNLYADQGKTIFSRKRLPLFQSMYPAAPIEKVIKQHFGDTRLSEAMKRILVTSYDIEHRRPHFFSSDIARYRDGSEKSHNLLMRDIARGTSAAPIYFPPKKINYEDSEEYIAVIDGGVFANNPVLNAYVEALKIIKEQGKSYDSILIVSLGTGSTDAPLPYNKIRRYGLGRWAFQIIDVVFDGVSDNNNYILSQILDARDNKQNHHQMYRFQIHLDKDEQRMDDASKENIARLMETARRLISQQMDDLKEVAELLSE